jgi:hypothetical protein
MTDPTYEPRRGDRVRALLYHENAPVLGEYRPREDYPDSLPPLDAAWVVTDDPQGPLMVSATTVEPAPVEKQADPLDHLRKAVRDVAAALQALPPVPRLEIPRLWLPQLIVPPVGQAAEPDKRHRLVSVTRAPVNRVSAVDHYRDENGLTWQTYGAEHDFSADRMLEVLNSDGEPIATYPPGAWLLVDYHEYRDTTA